MGQGFFLVQKSAHLLKTRKWETCLGDEIEVTYYMSPDRGTCYHLLFQFVLPTCHYGDAYSNPTTRFALVMMKRLFYY